MEIQGAKIHNHIVWTRRRVMNMKHITYELDGMGALGKRFRERFWREKSVQLWELVLFKQGHSLV